MPNPNDDLYVCLEFPEEDSHDFYEPVLIVMTISGKYGATVFDALRSCRVYCLEDTTMDRYLTRGELEFLRQASENPVASQFSCYSYWRKNVCFKHDQRIRSEHAAAAEEGAGRSAAFPSGPRRGVPDGPSGLRAVAW